MALPRGWLPAAQRANLGQVTRVAGFSASGSQALLPTFHDAGLTSRQDGYSALASPRGAGAWSVTSGTSELKDPLLYGHKDERFSSGLTVFAERGGQ